MTTPFHHVVLTCSEAPVDISGAGLEGGKQVKVRDIIRGGAVAAASVALVSVGAGMRLTAANLGHGTGDLTTQQPTGQGTTPSTVVTLPSTGGIPTQTQVIRLPSGKTQLAGHVTILPSAWAAQAAPYVTTQGLTVTLSPAFKAVSSPEEYLAVKNLVDAYNNAPVDLKTVGVSVTVRVSPTKASGGAPPDSWIGSGGCSGWESFQFEGWDGFQWYMNQCFATGLVDDLVAGATLTALVAAALAPTGAGAVAAGVAEALVAAAGGAAAYLAETQSMCSNRNLWIGLHHWAIPSHGCA